MFSIENFQQQIKNTYSQEISFTHFKELQNLINSFNCDFYTLLQQANRFFYIYTDNYNPTYINAFGLMLNECDKNFVFVNCMWKCFNKQLRTIIIFPKKESNNIYNKVNRLERLKAFL